MNRIHRSTSPWRSLRSLVLIGLVAGAAAACNDSDEPTGPKTPADSLTVLKNFRAEDISADGKTVLLTDVTSATADFYFYDVATKVSTLQGSPGDVLYDYATGISNGLRVSATHGKPENAALWDQATGWHDLGSSYATGCVFEDSTGANDKSGGFDVDSAGHAAVGLIWNGCHAEAFMWSDAGGSGAFIPLELLGEGSPDDSTSIPNNRATVISDDGLTAGGFASVVANVGGTDYGIDRWPAIWTAAGSGFLVPANGVFTDDSPGEVLAMAGNGSLVTGVWNQMPFIWSSTLGTINLASGSYEGFQGYGQAVALNGQLVFGTMQDGAFGTPFPFVWTQAGGVKSILDIATANGIALPADYWWQSIVAVSADGTVVVGTAYDPEYNYNTYVLKLPVSVYGL